MSTIPTDLPEDFPHRDKLARAGLNRHATVKNHRSFGSVRDLSPGEAREIEAYLSGETESSTDYTVSEVKEMAEDMDEDELAAFIEGDDRKTVQALLD